MEAKRPAIKSRSDLGLEAWQDIRQRVESGQSCNDVGLIYGVAPGTIRARSNNNQWATPARRKKWGAALGAKTKPASPPATQSQASLATYSGITEKPEKSRELAISKAHSLLLADLEKLALAPPADFQSGLARVAQSAIAQGLREIPIPQNIKELQTFFGIWRQASGLADKGGAAGSGGLFDPLRTVTRTPRAGGPVVDVAPAEDAEAVPDLGPEDEV